jgi:hypothetical protein
MFAPLCVLLLAAVVAQIGFPCVISLVIVAIARTALAALTAAPFVIILLSLVERIPERLCVISTDTVSTLIYISPMVCIKALYFIAFRDYTRYAGIPIVLYCMTVL